MPDRTPWRYTWSSASSLLQCHLHIPGKFPSATSSAVEQAYVLSTQLSEPVKSWSSLRTHQVGLKVAREVLCPESAV